MKIRTALISVSDKSGVGELAAELAAAGVAIYSTGGTAAALRAAGVEVLDIGELTGAGGDGEMLGGRVKTLHSNLHAAVLADMRDAAHKKELAGRGIPKVDLVVVNFYPFALAAAAESAGADDADAIANIDIGGPTLARAAAKNYHSTAVLTSPADYAVFVGQLKKNGGEISVDARRRWAAKAFVAVAGLDADIANYFSAGGGEDDSAAAAGKEADDAGGDGGGAAAENLFPPQLFLRLEKISDLHYGENPHQRAACYAEYAALGGGAGGAAATGGLSQLQGGAASYNNLLDAHSACLAVGLHTPPAAAIVKHNNPCGVAVGDNLKIALQRAYRADKTSAYGGIVAFNRAVDADTAEALREGFWEVVIAPQFAARAKTLLAEKERTKVFLSSAFAGGRRAVGGNDRMLLLQTPDAVSAAGWRTASARRATKSEMENLRFAWRVAAAVKSNAVVLARGGATIGIGAGQTSRVDSAWLACEKAKRAKGGAARAVAASDGFFPFADGLETLAAAGVSAVVQPGGSKNDAQVVAAADALGLAMVFSGRRHFRH